MKTKHLEIRTCEVFSYSTFNFFTQQDIKMGDKMRIAEELSGDDGNMKTVFIAIGNIIKKNYKRAGNKEGLFFFLIWLCS